LDATTAFAFLLGMLAVGMALARSGVLPANAPDTLNQVVLWVCLPASILLHAPSLPLSLDVLVLGAIPWVTAVGGAAVAWTIARWRGWPDSVTAVVMLAVALGNTSFLGYPLVTALLGADALRHAVIVDQLGTFLLLTTAGLAVIARYGHGPAPDARAIVLRILRFPPFVALVVALLLMPDRYPPAVAAVLGRLADALLPLVAIAVGAQLKLRLPRESLGPLAVGLAGKLVVVPALAFGAAVLAGLPVDVRAVLVLEMAMPPMITAMALAAAAGLAPTLASAMVGYGVVASLVLLPLWRWVLAG
jgi:predicted permease